MSRKLALVQWSKTLAVLLIIAGLQILLLDVALFIAYQDSIKSINKLRIINDMNKIIQIKKTM